MKTTKDKKRRTLRNLPGHTSLLIWNIPKDTKHTFKISCVEQGVTMRETILKFLRTFSTPSDA